MQKRSLLERFEEKVAKQKSGCWLWTSATDGRYGIIWIGKGKSDYAHRVAYRLYVGAIPAKHFVCHKCDTGLCVNPSHLFVGTAQDNVLDAVRKGRWSPQHGSHNPRSKLTPTVIKQIRRFRKQGMLHKDIAVQFGVGREAVSKILRGERWTKV